jgi:uncharacterized protein (UPF0332 family)
MKKTNEVKTAYQVTNLLVDYGIDVTKHSTIGALYKENYIT